MARIPSHRHRSPLRPRAAGGPSAPVVSARDLCVSFSSGERRQEVLSGLDVEIHQHDFTVIMGPSGAGKSTLLYALAGLQRPTHGTVHLAGADVTAMDDDGLAVLRRRVCGFVFQQHQLLESMSLMDNVIVAGALTVRSVSRIERKARELFARVNLDEATQSRTSAQVSGGEAQRASIVRALINDPLLVFADEPTGALNSRNTEAVLDVLCDLHQRGQGIVMVTHDRRSALRASRVLYLRDGAIVGECLLGTYGQNPFDEREHRLAGFLEEMGW